MCLVLLLPSWAANTGLLTIVQRCALRLQSAEDLRAPGCDAMRAAAEVAATPLHVLPCPCALCSLWSVSPPHFAVRTLTHTQGCCVCGRSCWHRDHLVATVSPNGFLQAGNNRTHRAPLVEGKIQSCRNEVDVPES